MEIRSAAIAPVRQDRNAIESWIKSSHVLVEKVGPPRATGPLPDWAIAQRKASLEARAQVKAQVDNWGYLGVLMADGGKARVEAFHNRLNDYLKTTPLWPAEHDKKV